MIDFDNLIERWEDHNLSASEVRKIFPFLDRNQKHFRWRLHLYVLQKGRCFYCNRIFEKRRNKLKYDPKGFSIDHVIPFSRIKTNEIVNVVLSCGECNNKKGDSIPSSEEYRRAAMIHEFIELNPMVNLYVQSRIS